MANVCVYIYGFMKLSLCTTVVRVYEIGIWRRFNCHFDDLMVISVQNKFQLEETQ